MATERYGIDLEVNLRGFKAKMNQAKNEAKSLGQALREVNKFDVVGGQGISIFSNKISIASGKAKALGTHFKLIKPAIHEATEETQDLNDEINQTSTISQNAGNNISTSFNKGLRSVKRLTIGFLGARSLFTLFRQQLSAYRSENEAFNQQMTLTSNIITTALAPAFEFFGNMIQYATLGLAKIIDIMFGTNISSKVLEAGLAKANNQLAEMSGGMNDVSDSAKEMKDNLLGIDEITNLQQEGTGTGLLSGIGGGADLGNLKDQFKALDDLKKKMKEVNEWFDKHPGVVNFFKTLGNIIKSIASFVVEHPWATLLGIGSFLTLKSLLPIIMGSSGIAGLTSALGPLGVAMAAALAITSWTNLIEKIEEAKKAVEDYKNTLKNINEGLKKNDDKYGEILSKYDEMIKKGEMNDQTWRNYLITLKYAIGNQESMIQNTKDSASWSEKVFGYSKDTKKELEESVSKIDEYNNRISKIPKEYLTKMEIDVDQAKSTNNFRRWGIDAAANITDIFKASFGAYTADFAKKHLLKKKADGGIFAGSWQPITAYASGGNPSFGEMFVAREAGPELVGTIGGHTAVMNNDQIVASVSAGVYQAVASAMSGQGNRPIVLNINGKEFAKATYSDYQEENSRRGTNTSIRRV